MSFERELARVVTELGLSLSAAELTQLSDHYALVVRWNNRINLTRITDPRESAIKHYGESLFLHRELPPTPSIVDVGSGAGFPGIPLAVARPDTEVVLIESVAKKAAFLTEASRELSNVEVVERRVREWAGSAEWAVMRAVSPDEVLSDIATRVTNIGYIGTSKPHGEQFKWEAGPEFPWGGRGRVWFGST